MGNSQHSNTLTVPSDFPIQKYMNQGLNQNQILQIKQAFDSYEPSDGRIDLNKIRKFAALDQPKYKIEQYLQNKSTMNFDEFFVMSKGVHEQILNSSGELLLDKDKIEARCGFCPYAIEKQN